jgi:hypothetical protein
MLYIAHRGNLSGPNKEKENHPDYLNEAIKANFDVETDLWLVNKKLFLGHDFPQYEIDIKYIRKIREYAWVHAKNVEALNYILNLSDDYRVFFHNTDDYTLVSGGFIWAYPGKEIVSDYCIAVMPERSLPVGFDLAGGICSDYIVNYKEKFNIFED